ncbi:MAG: hypothetical protein R3C13_07425 [Hyphomonas sp.]|uniref:hypothetical protein n=1 Tax=Hyphomonas sp. TaxID=87 RepID=UPI0035299091
MILRRLTENVKSQNWFAVVLDFFIVVLGVFIGVQLGNWNTARREHESYLHALDRYRSEIVTNLATLDTVDAEANLRLVIIGKAFDALQTCEDTPENEDLIRKGLRGLMGTSGLKLRTNALDDLTSSPILLAQQPEILRTRLADTRNLMDVFLREADFIELIPLEERAQNNPLLRVGASTDSIVKYVGMDYSRPERQLELTVPISEACKDNMLNKSFYTWERWQAALPAVTRVLRARIEEDLETLGGPTAHPASQ